LRAPLPHPDSLILLEESACLNPGICQSGRDDVWRLAQQPEQLAAAGTLYYGLLMADFALPSALEYEVWREQAAVQLQQRYLGLLQRLVEEETAAARHGRYWVWTATMMLGKHKGHEGRRGRRLRLINSRFR
jgi:hypothetical protein